MFLGRCSSGDRVTHKMVRGGGLLMVSMRWFHNVGQIR